MRLFRRATAGSGRHSLGAAVTAIPSVVPRVQPALCELVPVQPVPVQPLPPEPVPVQPLPVQPVSLQPVLRIPAQPPGPPVARLRLPSRSTVLAAAEQLPVAPRVQLVFRDGTCTDLDPTSAQARALRQLADALTRSG